jgi:hypothetical protein
VKKYFLQGVRQLLVTANVLSAPICVPR